MRNSAVHKHRTQKIEVNAEWRGIIRNLRRLPGKRVVYNLYSGQINAGRDFLRHELKRICEHIVSAKSLQKHEYQNVDADKRIINIRCNYYVRIVVADWKHFCKSPCFSLKFYQLRFQDSAKLRI